MLIVSNRCKFRSSNRPLAPGTKLLQFSQAKYLINWWLRRQNLGSTTAFWQLQGKNKKIQLYLFYKKAKDSFLHLIKISILFVFEQTTLPCSAKSTHLCWALHCFLKLLDAVPPTGYSLAEASTLTITFCFSLKVTADVAGKGRRQTEISDTKTPKHWIKWDRVDTFHICCWIINRWKPLGIHLNLIKTIPRRPTVTEYEVSLNICNLVSACDWKLPCLSDTFPK